jgi:hypothetical protein
MMIGYCLERAQQDVLEFIHRVKHEHPVTEPGVFVSDEKRQLCINLIEEEMNELLAALGRGDVVEAIDGGIDSIYVILYMFNMLGVSAEEHWVEVQRSNMAKAGGPKDPVTGKQLKPPGWTPPAVASILKRQKEEYARRLLQESLPMEGK